MNWPAWLFVVAAGATVFCTAVNCYTWRLAYPLWRFVPPQQFGRLHAEYLRLLAPVITVPHIVMFCASGMLLRWRPTCFSLRQAAALFVLDAGVVLLSLLWAGPIHTGFERARLPDEAGLRTLIRISALRSGVMLAASALVGRTIADTLSR